MKRRGKTHKRTRQRAATREINEDKGLHRKLAELGRSHPISALCERVRYANNITREVDCLWDVEHSTPRVFAFLFIFYLHPEDATAETLDSSMQRLMSATKEVLAPVQRWMFDPGEFLEDHEGNVLTRNPWMFRYTMRLRVWVYVAKEIPRTEVLW